MRRKKRATNWPAGRPRPLTWFRLSVAIGLSGVKVQAHQSRHHSSAMQGVGKQPWQLHSPTRVLVCALRVGAIHTNPPAETLGYQHPKKIDQMIIVWFLLHTSPKVASSTGGPLSFATASAPFGPSPRDQTPRDNSPGLPAHQNPPRPTPSKRTTVWRCWGSERGGGGVWGGFLEVLSRLGGKDKIKLEFWPGLIYCWYFPIWRNDYLSKPFMVGCLAVKTSASKESPRHWDLPEPVAGSASTPRAVQRRPP